MRVHLPAKDISELLSCKLQIIGFSAFIIKIIVAKWTCKMYTADIRSHQISRGRKERSYDKRGK